MNTASIILALLKLAASLTQWAVTRQAMDAGKDREVARAALVVLEHTHRGKEIRAAIANMTEDESDDLWSRMVGP